MKMKTVSTKLSWLDILNAWKVRWGIGRMNYRIKSGLYAVGDPDKDSPVLVSANYKLTFDILRKNLKGIDCWLLILDTEGINVWCAAGKGTFGTMNLINEIYRTHLSEFINHKVLIVPQLGAVGIDANKIFEATGFNVLYGPIRAKDIKQYLQSGCTATIEMRTVHFDMYDRLILTPMELIPALEKSFFVIGLLTFLNLFIRKPFTKKDYHGLFTSIFTGSVITPILLPYIPGRAFSIKGAITGFLGTALSQKPKNPALALGHFLIFPAISSYLALNFTGSSTYTSPSGVEKEMRKALPFIIGGIVIGSLLTLGVHLLGKEKKNET